jgi:hypothetical protein
MTMKRKPHQQGLDPSKPGKQINQDDLRTASAGYQRELKRREEAAGVEPGALAGSGVPHEVPENLTGAPPGGNGQPPPPTPPPQSGEPEGVLPTGYQAKAPKEAEEEHPLLGQLEADFGLKKLKVKHIELAGYRWTFRPMSFQDYEWMSSKGTEIDAQGVEPSMSVANVAATLAAINGTPVYTVFKIDVLGRHIPDPLNPPPDIKYEAAQYLLEWFRNKIGMWELVGSLDEQTDILFEEERSEVYPLWASLASPLRRRLVELSTTLKTSIEESGNPGDDASQSQESSPPTSEPDGSGTTPPPKTSFSTGTKESSGTTSTT